MRVVGGKLRSRPLAGPKSNAVRPTSNRLREALFNILTHSYGDPVTGARVLDLFAGTGALGIEAISRGAVYALFVDEGVEARALLRDNTESLGLGGVTRIFRRDATALGPHIRLSRFRWYSSIRPMARASRKRHWPPPAKEDGLNPTR